jgi:hypothetical protein
MMAEAPWITAARRIEASIKADVANPALRHLARCEGSAVGACGECLLCQADQGETTVRCVRANR